MRTGFHALEGGGGERCVASAGDVEALHSRNAIPGYTKNATRTFMILLLETAA